MIKNYALKFKNNIRILTYIKLHKIIYCYITYFLFSILKIGLLEIIYIYIFFISKYFFFNFLDIIKLVKSNFF